MPKIKIKTYPMGDISQNNLRRRWNELAIRVNSLENKKPKAKRCAPLPLLNTVGNCCGLSHAHVFYHQHGWGALFYALLDTLATKNMDKLVRDFTATKQNAYVKDLIKLMTMVKSVQEKQQNSRNWDFDKNINADQKYHHPLIINNEEDIIKQLKKLNGNDAFEITFHKHSITVYKDKNNCYQAYDSNWGRRFEKTPDISKTARAVRNALRNGFITSLVRSPFYRLDQKVFGYVLSLINNAIPIARRFITPPIVASFRYYGSKQNTKNPAFLTNSDQLPQQQALPPRSSHRSLLTRFVNSIFSDNYASAAYLSIRSDEVATLKKYMETWSLNPNQAWSVYGLGTTQTNSPIKTAIINNAHKCLQYLLSQKNVDLNIRQDGLGHSYLHVAALWGNEQITQTLLNHGADPNQFNHENESPLTFALKRGNFPVAALLISKMTEINHRDNAGQSYLHLAASCSDPEIINALLAKGADPNAVNDQKETPLMVAILRGEFEIAKILYPLTKHNVLTSLRPLKEHEQKNIRDFLFELYNQVTPIKPNEPVARMRI